MGQVRDRRSGGWRLAGVVGLGLMLVLLPACESMRGGEVETRATASAVRDPVLQDIPKPASFVLDHERSVAIASGKFRLAKCEYAGSLGPSAVKRFYEEYMPSAGFELRQWSLDQGAFNMRFEGSSEVCTVRARPGGWRKTVVVVEITPKPQGSPQRESKPPMRRPK